MTLSARAELTNAVRRRYGVATGAEKRKILDEFIAVTGYHEKSAIRALNAEPTVKKRQTRVRPSLYDAAVRAALIVLWEASDRVCGKRCCRSCYRPWSATDICVLLIPCAKGSWP
jgi:hypothetical protein